MRVLAAVLLCVALPAHAVDPRVRAALSVPKNVTLQGAPSITNAETLDLSGRAPAGSTVSIYVGESVDGTATLTGKAWTYTLTLPESTIAVYATNGTKSSPVYTILVDRTAPSAPTLTCDPDGLTNETDLVCSGTAEANATVKVFDGAVLEATVTADGDGAYTCDVTDLADDTYSFTSKAVDAATNESAASDAVAVTVDTQHPGSPVIVSPTHGSTVSSPVTLEGTAEADSTVACDNGFGSMTATGGAWESAATALDDGNYTVSCTATDAATNTSPAATRQFTVATASGIEFDATAHPGGAVITATQAASASLTSPAFSTAGTNRVLVLALTGYGGSSTIEASTVDGCSPTGTGCSGALTWTRAVGSAASSTRRAEIWTAVAAAQLSGATVSVAWGQSIGSTMNLVAVSGADTTDPVGATNVGAGSNSTALSINVTLEAAGSLVVGSFAQNTSETPAALADSTLATSADVNSRRHSHFRRTDLTIAGDVGQARAVGGTLVTQTFWHGAAAEIKEAP